MRSSFWNGIILFVKIVLLYCGVFFVFDLVVLAFLLYYRLPFLPTLIFALFWICILFTPIPRIPIFQNYLYDFLQCWLEDHGLIWLDETVPDQIFKKKKPSLLCYHPHGCWIMSSLVNGIGTPQFQSANVRSFIDPACYITPIAKICWQALGTVSCGANSMKSLMSSKSKEPFLLVPGGTQEMLMTDPGVHRLYLKKRRGFICYCLRYGYCPVPFYTFGETELYRITLLPRKTHWQRKVFKNLNFVLGHLFWVKGWKIFGIGTLLPERKCLYTFAGSRMSEDEFPTHGISNPTDQQVRKYHALYMKKLIEVRKMAIEYMEEHKDRFGEVKKGKFSLE